MDFLDSLELETSKYKKSNRVRSWYLYEQYKSLERNQRDAARKLKSRSYQDRLLRQELCERRARRSLCDHVGASRSDLGIEAKSTKTSLDVSADDFESYHELHELLDDEAMNRTIVYDYGDDDTSQDSQSVKGEEPEEIKQEDEPKDDCSFVKSVDSVVNVKSEQTLTEDMKTYNMKIEKKPKFQNMELNFEEVKQKLQYLEKMSRVREIESFPDHEDSLYSIEEEDLKHVAVRDNKHADAVENNVYLMWTKLVSFAYQLMELNHGNCYYDYGSQLLTAVLACDVLRRGINSMCHILQPYVSPLKYNTDSDQDVMKTQKNTKRKKPRSSFRKRHGHHSHKVRQHNQGDAKNKENNSSTIATCYDYLDYLGTTGNYLDYSKSFCKDPMYEIPYRGAYSEPTRNITRNTTNKENLVTSTINQNIRPYLKNEGISKKSFRIKSCTTCCPKVVNPMLNLSRYLERIMREIND